MIDPCVKRIIYLDSDVLVLDRYNHISYQLLHPFKKHLSGNLHSTHDRS